MKQATQHMNCASCLPNGLSQEVWSHSQNLKLVLDVLLIRSEQRETWRSKSPDIKAVGQKDDNSK